MPHAFYIQDKFTLITAYFKGFIWIPEKLFGWWLRYKFKDNYSEYANRRYLSETSNKKIYFSLII